MLSQKEASRMHPHFLHSIRGTGNPPGGPNCSLNRPFASVCDNIDGHPCIYNFFYILFQGIVQIRRITLESVRLGHLKAIVPVLT